MKILWVKTDFLHPTNRGGQIRTLETLRQLHRNHEIHYVAYSDSAEAEGVQRASEYCSYAYPVNRPIPRRGSLAFLLQLARNLVSPLPLAVGRYVSDQMRNVIQELVSQQAFDSIVCDFLSVAPNMPDLSRSVLFQHNVETMIWRRHADHGKTIFHRAYFRLQSDRMFRCEREVCRSAAHVIAVSESDALLMKELFGAAHISAVPTGVDLEYFARPADLPRSDAIVFVGAMDWLPNIDGSKWFTSEILPRIWAERPATRMVFAGRSPAQEIQALALSDQRIEVTGTVPDVRPYLWNAAISVVPLRIGGGTRLKIYEAMAASIPVVSTAVGAEGLAVKNGSTISLADSPDEFAARCLELLKSEKKAEAFANAALSLVQQRFSWAQVGQHFESVLQTVCAV